MAPEELLTLPRTRHEAMSVGSNKYFTVEPCKHGHTSGRYTNTSSCVKCLSIYRMSRDPKKVNASQAKYTLENFEKVKARKAKFRLENPEKVRAWKAKYRFENPEKLRAKGAKYRLENLEKIRAKEVKYKLENPEKVLQASMKCIQLVKPSYIAQILKVPTKQLTPEIIELKRLQIQLYRAIKSIKESK